MFSTVCDFWGGKGEVGAVRGWGRGQEGGLVFTTIKTVHTVFTKVFRATETTFWVMKV